MHYKSKKLLRTINRMLPKFMFWTGTGITAAGVVLACSDTASASRDGVLEKGKDIFNKELSPEERAQALLSVGKYYIRSALTMVTGTGLILMSHVKLKHENAKLVASIAASAMTLSEFRKRVSEEYGNGDDAAIMAGKTEVFDYNNDHEVIVPEDSVFNDFTIPLSKYHSTKWDVADIYNQALIERVEEIVNKELELYGTVIMNDARELFGVKRTESGEIWGWFDSPNLPLNRIILTTAKAVFYGKDIHGNSERTKGYLIVLKPDGDVFDKRFN